MNRRTMLLGVTAAALAAGVNAQARQFAHSDGVRTMAILPVQFLPAIGGHAVDPQATLCFWGPFQAGDEGEPIQVYAYQRFAWHFTGNPQGGIITNPNVPIMPDRSMAISGSNDSVCYGPVFTFDAIDPAGMNNRTGDSLRTSWDDGAYMFLKPKAGGTANPAGPDCALLLYCTRFFGPRTA
jgi:hypothetical protein